MKNHFRLILLTLLGVLLGASIPYLYENLTEMSKTAGYRELEMKVNVAGDDLMIWKTVIAPQHNNIPGIAMHRHEYARILIPLTEGVLQRRDADGSTTDYILTVGKPLFLPEDTENGFHTDENLGNKPIEVMVVQFTQTPISVEKLSAADLKEVMN